MTTCHQLACNQLDIDPPQQRPSSYRRRRYLPSLDAVACLSQEGSGSSRTATTTLSPKLKYLGDDINILQQNQAAMMISSQNAAMMISSRKIQSLDPAKAGVPTSERANSGITAWKILTRTSHSVVADVS